MTAARVKKFTETRTQCVKCVVWRLVCFILIASLNIWDTNELKICAVHNYTWSDLALYLLAYHYISVCLVLSVFLSISGGPDPYSEDHDSFCLETEISVIKLIIQTQ